MSLSQEEKDHFQDRVLPNFPKILDLLPADLRKRDAVLRAISEAFVSGYRQGIADYEAVHTSAVVNVIQGH